MSHFSGGYSVAIVQNGNVVETRQDSQVAIPFGSDYAIKLINRNARRAVAIVSIDGQNVSEGGIVVKANSFFLLECPVDKPVTFRFASTESRAAEAHGKGGPDVLGDKGLIKVEWRPEKVYQQYETGYLSKRLSEDYEPEKFGRRKYCTRPESSLSFAPPREEMTKTSGGIKLPDSSLAKSGTARGLQSGVTVEGQHSSQTFRRVQFDIDYSVPIIVTTIKLMGYLAEEGIPLSGVRHCPSCNTRTMKPTDKFCRQCGERF